MSYSAWDSSRSRETTTNETCTFTSLADQLIDFSLQAIATKFTINSPLLHCSLDVYLHEIETDFKDSRTRLANAQRHRPYHHHHHLNRHHLTLKAHVASSLQTSMMDVPPSTSDSFVAR